MPPREGARAGRGEGGSGSGSGKGNGRKDTSTPPAAATERTAAPQKAQKPQKPQKPQKTQRTQGTASAKNTKAAENADSAENAKGAKGAKQAGRGEEEAGPAARPVDQPTAVLQLPSQKAGQGRPAKNRKAAAPGRPNGPGASGVSAAGAPAGAAETGAGGPTGKGGTAGEAGDAGASRGAAAAGGTPKTGGTAATDGTEKAERPAGDGESGRSGTPGRVAAASAAAGLGAGARIGERPSAADRPGGSGEGEQRSGTSGSAKSAGSPAAPDATPPADAPQDKAPQDKAKQSKAPQDKAKQGQDPQGKTSQDAPDAPDTTSRDSRGETARNATAEGAEDKAPQGKPAAGKATRDAATRIIAPAKPTPAAPERAPGGKPAAPERRDRPVDQPTTALRLPEPEARKTGAPPAPERPAPVLKPLVTPEQAAEERARVAAPPKPTAPPPPADSERDPLELLAALTNRPAPPPTLLRTSVRRVKIWTPLVVLLLLVVGVVQVVRPLPDPSLHLTAADSYTFEGEAPEVPWPGPGQAALNVVGVGTFGTAGEQEPVPIASVAKVMTAYLILKHHPVAEDSDGASIPVDAQAESDAGLSEENESTVDVREGETLTEREALQAILIASANNVARLLARWDTGSDSEEEFVRQMNDAAHELGMDHTTYTDPSGLDETTVSTAADQAILARAAMEDPLFREIVQMPAYVDSHGDEHDNWNGLVPVNNVVGIKTGTTTAAGGCLMFAARQDVAGTSQLIVGVVLGQPPAEADNSILTEVLNVSDTLIRFAQNQLRSENVLAEGDVVGYVDDGFGGHTPVVVTEDVPAVGWDGLRVDVTIEESADGLPRSAEAGTEVGTLTVAGVEVPVALAADLAEPGIGDRLTRVG
ncbi:D-alanyl-D-alanine carboxypeptidase [Streptomyces hoynatensis]|uniref:D-alanyl-D-alanine carboxypeptidase n=1 Tax=Streptomyces hoynatensis TaxID=1141874 RepID=A0A3A9YP73_9ACTN|nr:D-alanyl-D-alanine carboxypeptidase [Streptomyces hoynatensis]